jgi:KDO II ethanolaminephosphotransferase
MPPEERILKLSNLTRSGHAETVALSVFMGVVLNFPIAWGRLGDFYEMKPGAWAHMAVELACVTSLTWLILSLGRILGRTVTRIMGVVIVFISAVCAYYMIFFKITIGHGVMNAVFTWDHDLSGEVVGWKVLLFLVIVGMGPTIWWWKAHGPHTSWYRQSRQLVALGWCLVPVAVSAIGFQWSQAQLNQIARQATHSDSDAPINLPGVVAHSYVPSNWIAATALVGYSRYREHQFAQTLAHPADRFDFKPTADLSHVHVVVVIGETARHDRFGLLGHDRNTTPRLSQEPNVAAFAARSCDTATKLSLACMFVRQGAIQTDPKTDIDTITERNVFAVFDRLGFNIDLYALQSEVGFYSQTLAKSYKFREVIAAQPHNAGKPVHDELLLPELAQSIQRPNPRGQPRLTILHTKGSHYLYTNRYPHAFAKWQPDCPSIDATCSKDHLLNAFDNSILYTDHVLSEAIQLLKGHKALLIYSSDHGESIEDGQHFHASPRATAPIDQRKVPLVFWASDELMKDPMVRDGLEQLKRRAQFSTPMQYGHLNLFPSVLSCLGIRSTDGGIDHKLDLCGPPMR